MLRWVREHKVFTGVVLVGFVITSYFLYGKLNPSVPEWVTATVERGDIRQIVSVSGFVEADNTAELAFPTTGRLTEIYVTEGEKIEAGTLLATIGQSQLAAQRSAALANLKKAEATRDELINGQTTEERAVTDATVAQAKAAWEQTVATELQKIKNAEIALRSNDLTAYAVDPEERATAPTISGSYNCSEEGTYTIEVYRSGTLSGYSFRFDGLESGTESVTIDQPTSFGECGLMVEFTAEDQYGLSEWTIPIPNTRSDSYLTYQNALLLTEQQATQNIQAAKDVLTLAENTAEKNTAAPRIEKLIAANASVAAAQAELARIDALIGDQSIFAPFAGTVTNVDKLPGEIATTQPFITLLAEDAFTLTARIPEIDITKIVTDQRAEVIFDANADEVLKGSVSYLSPLATEIDGVAYFEAKVQLTAIPDWLRSGLNADINIVTAEVTNALRLPNRFILTEETGDYILIPSGERTERTSVELGFIGNDGYVEVTSLEPGTTVVAP